MPKKNTVKKEKQLQLPVVDTNGKAKGTVTVPEELFGAKIRPRLMAQALRAYHANQREGGASTKTRGEVRGSTRKIYRQKGTGRARHGAIRAPVFVGGGIIFGPKPRDYHLDMPKKMKRLSLASALTYQREQNNIIVVDGMEELKPKTKIVGSALSTVGALRSALLIVPIDAKTVIRGAKNLPGVDIVPPNSLSTYEILVHHKIVIAKDAIPALAKAFVKG